MPNPPKITANIKLSHAKILMSEAIPKVEEDISKISKFSFCTPDRVTYKSCTIYFMYT